jgi:hypothetical protein
VQVRVSAQLRNYLMSQKRYHEPLDRIADRIFWKPEIREAIENNVDFQEVLDNKDKIIKALTEENRILRQRVKDKRMIDMTLSKFIND